MKTQNMKCCVIVFFYFMIDLQYIISFEYFQIKNELNAFLPRCVLLVVQKKPCYCFHPTTWLSLSEDNVT